jgi:hypothetical protein
MLVKVVHINETSIRLSGGGDNRSRSWGSLSSLLSLDLLSSSGGSLGGGILKRSNGSGLIDLGRVLVNLRGSSNLALRLALEEVANTGGETAANFSSLVRGLLILLRECEIK